MNVLLIGDSCRDEYVYGDCNRLSPEGPITILDEKSRKIRPGMAANVKSNLESFGVGVNLLTQREVITKTRYVDSKSNYQLLRVDTTPDVTPITSAEVRMALMSFEYDAVVISDYDKGYLSDDDLRLLCEAFNRPIFVDTKKRKLFHKDNVFWKINKKEYDLLDREHMPNGTHLIVTLGSDGVDWNGIRYLPKKVNVFDVCGAGDTFLTALVWEFMKHKDMQKSIDIANRAAAISVQHPGTYHLTEKEIESLWSTDEET